MGSDTDESGKLHISRKIKKSFQYEKYLSVVKSVKYRRALTALWIASHRLEIETGRWVKKENGEKLERSERLCIFCKENGIQVMGDEVHAVIACKQFESERKTLFKCIIEKFPLFQSLNDMHKLLFLLSIEDNVINKVAKFMHQVLTVERKFPSKATNSKCKRKRKGKKSRLISIMAP